MNKYLLMSAAAFLGSAGAAHAGTHNFSFASSGGHSYCDGGTITTGLSGGIADAWIHTNNDCAGGTSQGAGLGGKAKGFGKIWLASDNYAAKQGNDSEVAFYTFNKKLTKWTMWICSSGTCFEGNAGLLNNVTAGTRGAKSHGTASTTAKLAQLIAEGRR